MAKVVALPPDNTARWKFSYGTGVDNHSMIVRTSDNATATQVSTAIDGLMTALNAELWNVAGIALERAAKGSSVYLPQSGAVVGKSWGSGLPSGQSRAWQYSATGRSRVSGRKTQLKVFGVKVVGDAQFRILIADAPWVDPVLNTLYAFPNDIFLAIDGQPVSWHTYLNLKVNDLLVKKLRGGG